jgi:hypothetical protein
MLIQKWSLTKKKKTEKYFSPIGRAINGNPR